ncbi:hypothetical protein [Terriglobus aquaticus]|uniref:Uncharacterized protein n=1 Tax=Terriglobus aquaticus TaxID=940139 RepID=A0ABW9KL68_9BACT|nr:hypothetical protein [Terriglobus aquaticus]
MSEIVQADDQSDALARRVTGSSLESLSKLLAASVFGLYAFGFLITSLHSFRYGFSEGNPLRPHILAAGLWFAFLLFIPVAILKEVKVRTREKMKEVQPWEALLRWYYGIILASNFLYFFSWAVFNFDEVKSSPFSWKTALYIAAFSVVAFHLFVFEKARFRKVSAFVLSSLICFGFYTSGESLVLRGVFTPTSLTLWITGISAVVFYEMTHQTPEGRWKRLPLEFLLALFIFSRYFYPHIKTAWGGGEPIPITIVLSKDSAVLPNARVSCFLLSETDAGYFLVGKGEERATFLPRSAVALVHYDFAIAKPSVFLPATPKAEPSAEAHSPSTESGIEHPHKSGDH